MAPNLALSYDSASGDGYLGRGWRLQGLSRIHRCGRNLAMDGESSGIDGSAGDQLCLDGQRLVEIAPDVWRTEPETFVRVTRVDDYTLLARAKDGTASFYTSAIRGSRIANGIPLDQVWLLDSVLDDAGNGWKVAYEPYERSGRITFRPTEIVYTHHYRTFPTSATQVPDEVGANKVTFKYRERPCYEAVSDGLPFVVCERLHSITATASDRDVEKLILVYTGNELSSVERYADSARTLLADRLTFHYRQPAAPPLATTSLPAETSIQQPEASWNSTFRQGAIVGDFNGDGRDDILYASRASGFQLATQIAANQGRTSVTVSPTTAHVSGYQYLPKNTRLIPADFNGDGDDELLFFSTRSGADFSPGILELQSNGTSFWTSPIAIESPPAAGLYLMVGDYTGDGRPDLVACRDDATQNETPFRFWRNTGSRLEPAAPQLNHLLEGNPIVEGQPLYDRWTEYRIGCADTQLVDLDNDGVAELVHAWNHSYGFEGERSTFENKVWVARLSTLAADDVLLNRGPGRKSEPQWLDGSWIDVTGDGYVDLVESTSGSEYVQVRRNRGAFSLGNFKVTDNAVRTAVGASFIPFDHDAYGRNQLLYLAEQRWRIADGVDKSFAEIADAAGCGPRGSQSGVKPPPPVMGDFDGDGAGDVLLPTTCGSGTASTQFSMLWGRGNAYLLESVESEVGGIGDRVEYSDRVPGTFVSEPGSQGNAATFYSLRHASSALVARHLAKDGPITSYVYRGSFHNFVRQEWVGFRQREVRTSYRVDHPPEITTYDYDLRLDAPTQSYPFAQHPRVVTTRREWSTGLLSGNTHGSRDAEIVTTTNDWHLQASIQGGRFVALLSELLVLQAIHNGDPAPQPAYAIGSQRLRIPTFDNRGNVTSEETLLLRGGETYYRTAATLDYYPADVQRWRIAQLRTKAAGACGHPFTACGPIEFPKIFTYDASTGVVDSITVDAGTEGGGLQVTSIVPDRYGNVEELSLAVEGREGLTTRFKYDPTHTFPTEATDELGKTQYRNFDSRFGTVVDEQVVGGQRTRYAYDAFGRIGHVDHPDGTRSVYTYDRADASNNELGGAFAVQPRTSVFEHAHSATDGKSLGLMGTFLDGLGRPVRTVKLGRRGAFVLSETSYDARGNVVSQTRPHLRGDSSQGVVVSDYNEIGSLVRRSAPGVDPLLLETTHVDLLAPEIAELVLGEMPSTLLQYITRQSKGGFETTISLADPRGLTRVTQNSASERSLMSHDQRGNLVELSDPNHQVRTWTYDSGGRLVALLDADARGVLQTAYGDQTSVFSYFADGLLRNVNSVGRGLTAYQYDAYGRETLRTTPEGSQTTIWDRDDSRGVAAIGQVMRVDGPQGASLSFSYDPQQFLNGVSQSVADAGGLSQTLARSWTNQYGRMTSLTYPGGSGALTVAYDYDDYGNAVVARHGTKVLWAEEDAYQGQQVSRERRVGGMLQRTFVPTTGALDNFSYTRDSATFGLMYTYDSRGRVESRQIGSEPISGFTYDSASRLHVVTRVVNGESTEVARYTYDAVGNMRTSPAGTHTPRYLDPEYLSGNGSTRVESAAGTSVYAYDSAGRQWVRAGPLVAGEQQAVSYTSFDLPRQILTGTGPTSELTDVVYAPDRSRALIRNSTSSVRSLGSLFEERRVASAGGNTTTYVNRVFVPGVGLVAEVEDAQQVGSGRSYRAVLEDELGSAIARHSEGAVAPEVEAFAPFGMPSNGTYREGSRFGGHNADGPLGLINMQGRILDPALGSFLTPDPIISDVLNAQTLAGYAYVRNDPLNLFDPTGFQDQNPNEPSNGNAGNAPATFDWKCTFFHWFIKKCWKASSNGSGGGGGGSASPATPTSTRPSPARPPLVTGMPFWSIPGSGANPGPVLFTPAASLTGGQEAALRSVATVGIAIVASFVPGVGEQMDYAVIADPSATEFERAMANISLTANAVGLIAGAPMLPNFGAFARGTANAAARGAANWKSVKSFQHTFLKHGEGAKVTRSLTDTARSTGRPQGQWLDNQAAADLLQSHRAAGLEGPVSVPIPSGLGQVIMPNGSVVNASRATLVPGPNGFVTAYPIP
jgi:RHS repeat-associated protein